MLFAQGGLRASMPDFADKSLAFNAILHPLLSSPFFAILTEKVRSPNLRRKWSKVDPSAVSYSGLTGHHQSDVSDGSGDVDTGSTSSHPIGGFAPSGEAERQGSCESYCETWDRTPNREKRKQRFAGCRLTGGLDAWRRLPPIINC